jgi:hypothetical protein
MSYYHPEGFTVNIVAIIAINHGHNCLDHPFCGEIVQLDVVVHFCREMIHVAGGTDGGPGREEPTIVVYWMTNWIDACRIGFLPWHMNHHAARYDGVLGQTTDTSVPATTITPSVRSGTGTWDSVVQQISLPSMVMQWWWRLQVVMLSRLGRCPPEWQQLRPRRNFVWVALCLVVFIRRISITGCQ